MARDLAQQRGVVVRLADAVGEQDQVPVRRAAREQLAVAGTQAEVDVGAAARQQPGDACERALLGRARPDPLHRHQDVRRDVEVDDPELVAMCREEVVVWRAALWAIVILRTPPAVSYMLPERSSTSSIARFRRCRSPGTRLATGSRRSSGLRA